MSQNICIKYGETPFNIALSRRQRKTMAIIVAPNGTVSAVAPHDASLEKIHERLKKRARWILRQQRFFEQFRPRTMPRRYVSGETHLYLGKQYRLKISIAKTPSVKLKGGYFVIVSTPSRPPAVVLEEWYTKQAIKTFTHILSDCLVNFSTIKKPPTLRIQKMKSRWASMSPNDRLTITPTLIRAPKICIEYVLMHELCHLIHRHHGAAFYRLLSVKIPNWEARKLRLEKTLA